jgi:hypothetical protein
LRRREEKRRRMRAKILFERYENEKKDRFE